MAKGKAAPKFFEVNGHGGCVNQVDNGLKLMKNLIKMMDIRSKIEEKYAADLEKFSQTHRKMFANMYENEHTKHVIMEMLTEADCTAHIHRQSRQRVLEECITKAKEFEKTTWNKGFFGSSKQQQDYAKKFSTAQKSWATVDKQYKSAKSKYDQACKAVITQQQIVNSHQTSDNDPKLAGAQQQLNTKENNRNNAREHYQGCVQKMEEMKDSYSSAMVVEYNGVEKFERQRLDFVREMLASFSELSKPITTSKMQVHIKGIQKGDDIVDINLEQKMNMIEQAVSGHSTDISISQFKKTLGPENAINMEWPAFREYDPEAEAAKAKMPSGAGEVATNGIEGTYQAQTADQPVYNGYVDETPQENEYTPQYSEPPPENFGQQNQAFDQWPEDTEPEPEPVQEPVVEESVVQPLVDDAEITLVAMYNYEKDEDDEVSFLEGDKIIKLSEPSEEGWFRGRLEKSGEEGLFPVIYVDMGEVDA